MSQCVVLDEFLKGGEIMLRAIKKKLRNKKGFTLVELIIVIAILGILTAIAVPKFSGFTTKAKTGADTANIKTIQNAVHVYEAEKGEYPDTATEMNDLINTYLNGEVPESKADKNKNFYIDSNGKVTLGTSGTLEVKITKASN